MVSPLYFSPPHGETIPKDKHDDPFVVISTATMPVPRCPHCNMVCTIEYCIHCETLI